MSRHFSAGKRAREQDQARKKREKAERRARKRDQPREEMPMASVEEIAGDLPSVEEAMAAIEAGPVAREAEPMPARLFVGGLSRSTTQESLAAAFAQYGPVADAFIVTDRDTGDSRGFGFVTMKDRKDASKAMEELDDSELDGRTIMVNVATERQR
jgi:hypothetical protein